jgi:hypothetical protein
MQSAFTTEQKNKINCFKHVNKHTPKLQQTNPSLANNIEQKNQASSTEQDLALLVYKGTLHEQNKQILLVIYLRSMQYC